VSAFTAEAMMAIPESKPAGIGEQGRLLRVEQPADLAQIDELANSEKRFDMVVVQFTGIERENRFALVETKKKSRRGPIERRAQIFAEQVEHFGTRRSPVFPAHQAFIVAQNKDATSLPRPLLIQPVLVLALLAGAIQVEVSIINHQSILSGTAGRCLLTGFDRLTQHVVFHASETARDEKFAANIRPHVNKITVAGF
jgi:hypothetical protein